MYERNAIVLERYFNQMFGYNMKNNIKTNFKDFSELVECLERYQNITEEEETIMQEYDAIANKIRDIQKKQEMLSQKNQRYQDEREELFENIDENANAIQKKLNNLNENIKDINEEIAKNGEQFTQIVADFAEKTSVRTSCGKKRRTIENEYNNKLNETLDNYRDIDIAAEKRARQFIDLDTTTIEKELKEKIKKNGEKENIPFNMDVVTKAIILNIDIHKRETDVLSGIYEKTNKLFTEIKNNSIKNDKNIKAIKDSKCKLEFLGTIKEYLIQFLDNERLTIVNGEEEHHKLMEEACKNLDEDLLQINNLYNLLLKEMTKKTTKKSYTELYNLEYLKSLEIKAEKFDAEIKKLNLPVTIINPNYWRVEGMKKIYDVFYKCITEEYGRDLSEYIKEAEVVEIQEEEETPKVEEKQEEAPKKANKRGRKKKEEPKPEEEKIEEKEETKPIEKKVEEKEELPESTVKAEIDKKIDLILGIEDDEEIEEEPEDEEDDDWDDEGFLDSFEDEELEEELEEDDFEDDYEEDLDSEEWDDDELDEEDFEEDLEEDDEWNDDFDEEDIEDFEEDDDDWGDDLLDEEASFIEDNDEDELEEDLDSEEWEDEEESIEPDKNDKAHIDIWGNSIEEKGKKKEDKVFEETAKDDDDWENEFINIKKRKDAKKKDKKNDNKKGGFLSKFKK